MNDTTIRTLESLSKLRLPELQARFAEIVGEPTRSPNKTYAERGDMRSRPIAMRGCSGIFTPLRAPLDTERSA